MDLYAMTEEQQDLIGEVIDGPLNDDQALDVERPAAINAA